MNARKLFSMLGVIAIVVALIPAASVTAAPADKVDVCHLNDDGTYIKINISQNAFQSHVDHGDASPGELVPGQPGKKFADDCSLISIEKLSLVETMEVNGTQPVVTWSKVILGMGQKYELRASGTYTFGKNWLNGTGIADAKYSYRTAGAAWVDGADLNPDPDLAYGLQVTLFDGDFDKPLTPVGWVEPYNDANIYTAPYTGKGEALGLLIWDNQYADNEGSITVEIYQVNW